jgi:hypothetical protein
MVDRDRTVLQRSKPNSGTTLFSEQLNPWNRLQLQDVINRHRGAKLHGRYGLLREISLLSLTYLLSVKQCPFHTVTLDHYNRNQYTSNSNFHSNFFYIITLFDMSILQLNKLMLLRSLKLFYIQFEFIFVRLSYSL